MGSEGGYASVVGYSFFGGVWFCFEGAIAVGVYHGGFHSHLLRRERLCCG